MNMQVSNEHFTSAAALTKLPSAGIDPIIKIIERHRSAECAFADFLKEKSRFEDSHRDADGCLPKSTSDMDAKEKSLCGLEREMAAELAETSPTTPEGAFLKLDYIASEHERGNRLFEEDELISIIRSFTDSGILPGKRQRRQKHQRDRAELAGAPSVDPVYALAKEFGRLIEKHHQLDAAASGPDKNTRAMMIIWDRMEAIYDQVSYLQSTSIIGAAFQAMIVKSHLDILTDVEGNTQRELLARLDRLLYRAVRNLVSTGDLRVAQDYLMDEHMNPFTVLDQARGGA